MAVESKIISILDDKQKSDEIVIEPSRGWLNFNLRDLWRYRDLLYFLTWRDIKVRYKQTVLGVAWAVLQPISTMVVFSIIFGRFAQLPSEGVPYPVFTLTALLPWQLFAYTLTQSSISLLVDQNLITKVYFPRLIIPISSVMAGLLDFAIAFAVMVGLLIVYQIPMTPRLFFLPFLVIYAVIAALAVGLWLSALNVKYRDVRYALPFLTQLWMFSTPIAYSSDLIPYHWRMFYSLNPMTGVIESFRWVILGNESSLGWMILISVAVVTVLFLSGLAYFKQMENSFADII